MNMIDRTYHERMIKNAVGWFFVGCIAFVALEFLLIYLGTMTFTHPELDWPSSFIIIGLGGLYLLWQMLGAMFFKTPLPEHYKPMDNDNYPEVSAIIDEITARLNLPLPHAVYVAPGLNAAVFSRPNMLSMLINPKRELVIGEMLLNTLRTDEMKVILYHEFGHYASGSLGKKTPIYVISQFSKSFTSVKKMKKPGVWRNMINSQIDLFSYFAFWLCSIIDRHYKPLAQGEEQAADDVAVDNMGAGLLVSTLVKVSLLQHYFRYCQWVEGKYKLHFNDEQMTGILLYLCRNHNSGIRSISQVIRHRIDRHISDKIQFHITSDVIKQLSQNVPSIIPMLLKLHPKYEEARLRSKSVILYFHLDRKKHKLPWVEGKYQILLDGRPIGNGNFIKGFDFSIRTSPGKHVVSIYGISGIITVPYEFVCQSGDWLLFDMDFKVHLSNGYYEIFVASSKNISEKNDRLKDTPMLI